MKVMRQRAVRVCFAGSVVTTAFLFIYLAALAVAQAPRTIVDEWAAVVPPPAPTLRAVTVDPKTTALLILDVQQQNCNVQRRPRCVASIPRIQSLLNRAIAKGMPVIYSTAGGAPETDIWWQVRPLGGEPLVTSGADKFFGTDLERILRDRGIRTIIPVGTAAHGAILFTSSSAALRGLQVVLPVDGSSAESLYIEQYVVFHLTNAPTISGRVTLTRSDLINF